MATLESMPVNFRLKKGGRREIVNDPIPHDIQVIMKKRKINFLYYLVHVDNMSSISQNGLLSRNRVPECDLAEDIADENVIETRQRKTFFNRSLLDFVPLYFTPKTPMLFVRREIQDKIAILCLNKNLLLEEGIVFTDGNAASMKTKALEIQWSLRTLIGSAFVPNTGQNLKTVGESAVLKFWFPTRFLFRMSKE